MVFNDVVRILFFGYQIYFFIPAQKFPCILLQLLQCIIVNVQLQKTAPLLQQRSDIFGPSLHNGLLFGDPLCYRSGMGGQTFKAGEHLNMLAILNQSGL